MVIGLRWGQRPQRKYPRVHEGKISPAKAEIIHALLRETNEPRTTLGQSQADECRCVRCRNK